MQKVEFLVAHVCYALTSNALI